MSRLIIALTALVSPFTAVVALLFPFGQWRSHSAYFNNFKLKYKYFVIANMYEGS
jgi:hypothetical protein